MVADVKRNRSSNEHYKPVGFRTGASECVADGQQMLHKAYFLPERRYILRPQICCSDSSVCSEMSTRDIKHQPYVAGILDSFTSLCVGGVSSEGTKTSEKRSRHKKKSRKSSAASKGRVVYPIASYPARLNSRKLVEQRRKSFRHQFFRPVSDDEFSMSNRRRTA
jgi:hypothetical protein